MNMRRLWLSLLVLLVACGGSDDVTPPNDPPSLAALAVSIATPMLGVGQTTRATAIGQDQNGALISLANVEWSSSNTEVATVSSSGVVTGARTGTATITATSGDITGSAIVNVGQSPPSGPVLIVVIAPPVINVGQSTTATAYDSSGTVIAPTNVAWSSSTPSVATIDASGTVKGIAPGADTITALWNGRTARNVVTVQVGALGLRSTR